MKNDFRVYASLLSATPEDVDNIASWLADREASIKIKNMKVDETIQDSASLASDVGGYDDNIATSQIRILSKQYTNDPDVIPYVAVVDEWDEGMWLVIPFSQYKTPATPGEMSTGINTFGLRVLQAWNGRTVQDELLKKCFLFGTLSEEVRRDALSLFRHEMGGVELPADFKSQRGSPIVEASDPRREYIAECISRLQPLSDAVISTAESFVTTPNLIECSWLTKEELKKVEDERYADEYCLAAATRIDTSPFVANKRSWKGEGCNVSDFDGYQAGEAPKTIVFTLNTPDGRDLVGKRVEAFTKADGLVFVGCGTIYEDDGEIKVDVVIGDINKSVGIESATDIILVLAEEHA